MPQKLAPQRQIPAKNTLLPLSRLWITGSFGKFFMAWSPTLPDSDFGGFIFDCDGTLAETMPTHYIAWCRALGEHAAFFPEPMFYELGGVPTARIIEVLNEKHSLSLPVHELVDRKEAIFLELSREIQPVAPVVAVAQHHHGRIPLAVASGGHRHIVHQTLRTLGITHLFETVVTSEDYTQGKPHPEPFLTAARRLGVPPERCLVFEDTETGLAAAQAAGMQCVLVPPAHLRRVS
jgi:beta-phosphoglucomutase family hydrolase